MGCDIHGFWEFKTPDGDWIAFEFINDGRSYSWFGIVADVRRLCGSTTANRGVPDDCSSAWRQLVDTWGRDLHSHTWLTPSEVQEANRQLFMSYKVEDGDDPEQFSANSSANFYEKVPDLQSTVQHLILPGPESAHKIMPWTGSLSENAGTSNIDECLRLVIAFDN